MSTEPAIAFVSRYPRPAGLEVRINFGIFAGRDATPAEVDELGTALAREVGLISVVSEHRHEFGPESEAQLHQVRVEIPEEELPREEADVAELSERIVGLAEGWAEACISQRPSSETAL